MSLVGDAYEDQWICVLPVTQLFPRILFTKHKRLSKHLRLWRGMQHWVRERLWYLLPSRGQIKLSPSLNWKYWNRCLREKWQSSYCFNLPPSSALLLHSADSGVWCLCYSMTLDPTVGVLKWAFVLTAFVPSRQRMLCLIHARLLCWLRWASVCTFPGFAVCKIKCWSGRDKESLASEPDPCVGTADPPLTPLIQTSPEWMIFKPNYSNDRKMSKHNIHKYLCIITHKISKEC